MTQGTTGLPAGFTVDEAPRETLPGGFTLDQEAGTLPEGFTPDLVIATSPEESGLPGGFTVDGVVGGLPEGFTVDKPKRYSFARDLFVEAPKELVKAVPAGAEISAGAVNTIGQAVSDEIGVVRQNVRGMIYNPEHPVSKLLQAVGIIGRKGDFTEGRLSTRGRFEGHGKGAQRGEKVLRAPPAAREINARVSRELRENAQWWIDQANTGWEAGNRDLERGGFLENPSIARVTRATGRSAAPMAVAAGLSWAGRPDLGAAVLSALEAAPSYTRAIENGASPAEAIAHATVSGVGTYYLEKIGLQAITKQSPLVKRAIQRLGDRFLAGAAVTYGVEGGTETLQQLYQNAVASGYDGDQKAFQGVLDAFLAGGLGGSMFYSMGETPAAIAKAYEARAPYSTPDKAYGLLRDKLGSENVRRLENGDTEFTLPDGRKYRMEHVADAGVLRQDPGQFFESVAAQNPKAAEAALAQANGDKAGAGTLLKGLFDATGATTTDVWILDPKSGAKVRVDVLGQLVSGEAKIGTLAHEDLHAVLRLAGLAQEGGRVVDPQSGESLSEETLAQALERGVNHPTTEKLRSTWNTVLNAFRRTDQETTFQAANRIADAARAKVRNLPRIGNVTGEEFQGLEAGGTGADIEQKVAEATEEGQKREVQGEAGQMQAQAQTAGPVTVPGTPSEAWETEDGGVAPVAQQAVPERGGAKVPARDEPARAATETTTVMGTAEGVPYPIEQVPVAGLKLSEDVPNFKRGANAAGVVEPLKGKFERLGTAPIVVWERADGTREIITGRHRWDLAKRSGEKTIAAQVVREADGFTKQMAAILDAESNIRDNQGEVSDYANYFRNREISEAEASGRGLLSRAKGRDGYAIGKHAADDLYTLYANGQISDSKASAIARSAPDNGDLQGQGIRFAKGHTAEETADYLRAIRTFTPGASAEQVDMFGRNDAWQQEAEKMATAAARARRGLEEERTTLRSASRLGREKAAGVRKRFGINPGDPQAVAGRLAELDAQLLRYERWFQDPALVAEIRSKAGLAARSPDLALAGQTPAEVEAERVRAEEQARAEAKARNAAEAEAASTAGRATPISTQGDLLDRGAAENPLFAVPAPGARATTPGTAFAVAPKVMRKTAERVAGSDEFKGMRVTVEGDPLNYRMPQKLSEVGDAVAAMGDVERAKYREQAKNLREYDSPQDNLMGAVLADDVLRLHAAGDLVGAAAAVRDMAQTMTVAAQMVRQAAMLKTTTPEGMVFMLEQSLERAGGRPLSGRDQARLLGRAEEDIAARQGAMAREQEYLEAPSVDAARRLDGARRKAVKASKAIMGDYGTLAPKSWASILVTLMQAGVLTPTSQIANIVGNLANNPLRGIAGTMGALYESLAYQLGIVKQRTIAQPIVSQLSGLRGAAGSVRQVPGVLATGMSMRDLAPGGEVREVMRPIAAWIRQATGKGLSLNDRAKLLVEGTLGMPAVAALRPLLLGDVPFYEGAYRRFLHEEGWLRGIRGPALAQWMETPSAESKARAEERALDAVFQGNTPAARIAATLANLGSNKDAPAAAQFAQAVLWRPVLLFSRTPANILWEASSFANPLHSAIEFIAAMQTGNQRRAFMALGKATVGVMLWTAARLLVAAGLVSGRQGNEKERQAGRAGGGMKSNRLNVSGLKRLLRGDDPGVRTGDISIDYRNLGTMGLVLNAVASGDEMLRAEAEQRGEYYQPGSHGIPGQLLAATGTLPMALLDYSMMKGTYNLLQSIERGNLSRMLPEWMNVLSAGVLPETLRKAAFVQQEYLPDTREEANSLRDGDAWLARIREFGNKQALKWSAVRGLKQRLTGGPAQVTPLDMRMATDILGRAVKSTPGERSPMWYHFVDVFKAEPVGTDPYMREIDRVFRSTNRRDVLPPLHGKAFTKKLLGPGGIPRDVVVPLRTDQAVRWQQMAGWWVLQGAANLMTSPGYQGLSDEERAVYLSYSHGAMTDIARQQFLAEINAGR